MMREEEEEGGRGKRRKGRTFPAPAVTSIVLQRRNWRRLGRRLRGQRGKKEEGGGGGKGEGKNAHLLLTLFFIPYASWYCGMEEGGEEEEKYISTTSS